MVRGRRSPLALAPIVALTFACGAQHAPSEATRYEGDAAFRRAELERSLASTTNGYAALRLAHYARDWDALPEWNPRVAPVSPRALEGAADPADPAEAAPLTLDAPIEDDAAMRALGERAFHRYPTQLAPYAAVAIASRAAAERYGLVVDDARGEVGGLVRVTLADGSASLAVTCATCHTDASLGAIRAGVGNGRLDLGRMIHDAADAPSPADPWLAWGRGRVDVTTTDGTMPVRIPDLRPTRVLTYLQQDADVAQRSRTSLAIRIETLIVTSHGEALRPPRKVAWAIALYVASLADDLSPAPAAGDPARDRGARTFAARCASCHAPPGLTGAPVPLDVVGTDPTFGRSPDRGTGAYRVPSLLGVATRPLLLHDASIGSLDAMFDPSRTRADFTGGARGVGAVPGHPFGLDLAAGDRADLVAYLRALR